MNICCYHKSVIQDNEQMELMHSLTGTPRFTLRCVAQPRAVTQRINSEELRVQCLCICPNTIEFRTLSIIHLHAGDPLHGTGKSQRPRVGRRSSIDTHVTYNHRPTPPIWLREYSFCAAERLLHLAPTNQESINTFVPSYRYVIGLKLSEWFAIQTYTISPASTAGSM
jgi:hypothetical protein